MVAPPKTALHPEAPPPTPAYKPYRAAPLTDGQRGWAARHHQAAYAAMVKEAVRLGLFWIGEDELRSEAHQALVNAARNYKPGRGMTPASFVFLAVRTHLRSLAERAARLPTTDTDRCGRHESQSGRGAGRTRRLLEELATAQAGDRGRGRPAEASEEANALLARLPADHRAALEMLFGLNGHREHTPAQVVRVLGKKRSWLWKVIEHARLVAKADGAEGRQEDRAARRRKAQAPAA